MEKIKVNDYLRTKEHGIFKVLKFVKTSYGYYWGINDKRKAFSIGKGGNLEVDITKHSSNILDLIEVGDYVNGYKVRCTKYEYFGHFFIDLEEDVDAGSGYGYQLHEKDIKSIVTHEQFESIKYRLE